MFLFLFRSKFRRKQAAAEHPVPLLLLLALATVRSSVAVTTYGAALDLCENVECGNGVCLNGTCLCHDGWQGSQCQYCGGKVKLNGTSGYISDGIGNYSLDVKCSWLIEAGNSTNSTIRLHFEEFITECGWDHLYIYDGDSVHSPLLGIYSGLMYSKEYSLHSVPEIVAHSGFVLLHFYSDVAYNLSGFNITYSLNTCPSTTSSEECSGHGICIDSICTCDAQFTGEACHIPICPNKCTASNGICDQEQHRCVCNPKYRGDDCSQVTDHGYWEVLKTSDFVPQGSASHTAVVWQDSMYIVGGESFKKGHMLYVYDFNGHVWETPHVISKTSPTIRYGHSSVLFGDKIYVYGGVKEDGMVCNELWAYDISAKSWENVTVNTGSCELNHVNIGFKNQALCGPLRSAGHTATLVPPIDTSQSPLSGPGSRYVTERMIIIFGHSPTYGFLNFVQEYYFGTREWAVVKTKGYPVKGGYGHSAAWDPVTGRILVYGGYVSMSPVKSALSSKLYAYNPYTHTWYLMSNGPSDRFLHSGSMLSPSGGLMLIYGGNIHNETGVNLASSGGQCYTAQPLLYDTYCDSWKTMSLPSNLFTSLMRFGHSAITFEKSMYIYGGFNGQMLNDIIKFSPGNCSSNNMITNCLNSHHFGIKCAWDNEKAICLPLSEIPSNTPSLDFESRYSLCSEESKSQVRGIYVQCNEQTTCESCVHTHRCGWCPLSNSCVHDIEQCTAPMNKDDVPFRSERPITYGYQCSKENADHMRCNHLHSCQSCVTHSNCHWDTKLDVPMCTPINLSSSNDSPSPVVCESVCDHYRECTNCTKDECIWCQNNERCIDKTAYTSSFPYGQCREWTTDAHRCRASPGNSQCNYYKTCMDCRDDPECGWCDDGSGTGLGSCMAGGNTPPQSCSKNKWYFTHCPTCQCNGHSTCMNNTDVCLHPCSNNTEGQNCETCIKGFYGNPVNGGECKECRCNNQGSHCNPENGKCYCTTKGIIGDNCEKCDSNNHYLGDPSNHGSCFYDLTIDYQFTFNLSKKDDLRFTQINFQNSPSKSDVDADFSITCSVMAKMNITVRPADGPEKMLLPLQNCTNFRTRFLKSEYMFGTYNNNMSLTTFYVYVYDFKPPLWIQISFSQYPKLNLQQFFITFSSCFLLLLLVAAILWKLKQKYDMYRRRQRMFVEMEQMASRPFSVVEMEIEKRNSVNGNQIPTISVSSNLRKRKIDVPNPVALEPCAGNKAAVLTLLVRQPTGNDRYTPYGYSGLAIASALVVVGNVQQSKTNVIDNGSSPLPGKEDVRWTGRGLKASQHPSEARI